MPTPTPGRRVRGSRTGRAINALFDLLGRRKALRVLWELSRAALNFRELQLAAETNPSLLNTRLRELREAALIAHEPGKGYALTRQGNDLVVALGPVFAWSERWKGNT